MTRHPNAFFTSAQALRCLALPLALGALGTTACKAPAGKTVDPEWPPYGCEIVKMSTLPAPQAPLVRQEPEIKGLSRAYEFKLPPGAKVKGELSFGIVSFAMNVARMETHAPRDPGFGINRSMKRPNSAFYENVSKETQTIYYVVYPTNPQEKSPYTVTFSVF